MPASLRYHDSIAADFWAAAVMQLSGPGLYR